MVRKVYIAACLILFLNELIQCDHLNKVSKNIRNKAKNLIKKPKLKKLEEEFIRNVSEVTQNHLDRVAKLEKRKFRFSSRVIVNDGTRFIVFNCTRPAYLDLSKNAIPVKNSEINKNQDGNNSQVNGKKVVCDLPTNIWREVDTTRRLISYSPGKKQFGYVFDEDDLKLVLRLDMYQLDSEQSKMVNNQSLIVSILKTFHHPRYFY